jgi:hypothetical protein
VTTTAWVIVAVAVVVLVAAVTVMRRNRSPQSSVDSFRRQIDALGPAARRTVVDQVQQTAATRDPEPDAPAAGDDDADDPADEDGARGS